MTHPITYRVYEITPFEYDYSLTQDVKWQATDMTDCDATALFDSTIEGLIEKIDEERGTDE